MPLEDMGYINGCRRAWGICGFCASLYAMYNNSPVGANAYGQVGLNRMAFQKSDFIVFIGEYFAELQQQNPVLLRDIATFTRTFPGFENFDMNNFILKAGLFISAKDANMASPVIAEDFSVALTPDAVVDFLKRRCAFGAANEATPVQVANANDRIANLPEECIVGLSAPQFNHGLYNGLAHWVYKLNNDFYSWGNQDVNSPGRYPMQAFITDNEFNGICSYITF